MTTYIVRRLILALIVIVIVTLLVFITIRLLPGDPILLYLSREDFSNLTLEQIQQVRHEFGLDKPLHIQYIDWVAGLFQGDMGMSLFYREDVGVLLGQRAPVTFYLGIIAFIISTIFGIGMGMLSALRRGKATDTVTTVLANIGITAPIFWVGILLIYLFGLKLQFLPIFGFTSPFTDFWLSTKQIILPVFCLAIFPIAASARQTRSSMLEVIRQDYIRTAWAKGLRERVIVIRHVLKNGLIPVITLKGMSLGHILGGSVLVETVFSIPGMGRLSVEAVFSQDYAIIQAVILITAVTVVFANLLVDIAYGWLDPRIRYG